MRIVFMGTPEFAVESLKALIGSTHEVCAVFTRRDAPKNRGMKLFPPPVKVCAAENNIPVYQPVSLKNEKWKRILREISPELIVVAAYGKILPVDILEMPKYGCINVHASLLPKYRGSSPINAAVLNGEKTSGITIIHMAEGIDTGDMLHKISTDIAESETYGQLHDRLALIGGQALLEAIDKIEKGEVHPEKQDEAEVCYASMIHTEDTIIDFAKDSTDVSQRIRAYDPQPGAFCYLGDTKAKLFSASLIPCEDTFGNPGEILECGKKGMTVACKKGKVLIGEIQLAGGKKMPAQAFYAGHRDIIGKVFTKQG